MLNTRAKTFTKSIFTFLAPILLLALMTAQRAAGIGLTINDPFHRGELFTSANTIAHSTIAPLTIHGATDYLLHLMLGNILGNKAAYWTIYLNSSILSITAAAILLAIGFKITQKQKTLDKFLYRSIFALIGGWHLVGAKDIGILLVTFLITKTTRNNNKSLVTAKKYRWPIIRDWPIALISGPALIWSFDRGLVTAAAIIGSSLMAYLASKNKAEKKEIHRFWILSTAICTFTILIQYLIGHGNYIENIAFLLDTSSNWSYLQLNERLGALQNIVYATVLITMAEVLQRRKLLINRFRTGDTHTIQLYSFLAIVTVMMLKIGTNRADIGHLLMTLWAPMIISTVLTENSTTQELPRGIYPMLTVVILALILTSQHIELANMSIIFYVALILVASALLTRPSDEKIRISMVSFALALMLSLSASSIRAGYKTFTKWKAPEAIITPMNAAKSKLTIFEMSREKELNAAKLLSKYKPECLLDMTNMGTFGEILKLPTCTKYSYVVYADENYEEGIISNLKEKKPSAIIYSSEEWPYSIDGRDMKTRFPGLNNYLTDTYRKTECINGYCIASIEK